MSSIVEPKTRKPRKNALKKPEAQQVVPVRRSPRKKRSDPEKRSRGRPKSIGYKGIPLPDDHLVVDYTGLFRPRHHSSDSSDISEEEDSPPLIKKSETCSKDNSILLSLLSAPPNKKAVKAYKAKSRATAASENKENIKKKRFRRKNYPSLLTLTMRLAGMTVENEADHYRHILGDRDLKVVVERLPVETVKAALYEKSEPKPSATRKKRNVSKRV